MAPPNERAPDGGNRSEALGNHKHANALTSAATSSSADAAEVADAKAFATLRAEFALVGHTLTRSTAADGAPCLVAERWGQTRELADLAEAHAFLTQIGGRHGL